MEKASVVFNKVCGYVGALVVAYFAIVFVFALAVGHATGSAIVMALAVVGLIGLIAVVIGVVVDLESDPPNSSLLSR